MTENNQSSSAIILQWKQVPGGPERDEVRNYNRVVNELVRYVERLEAIGRISGSQIFLEITGTKSIVILQGDSFAELNRLSEERVHQDVLLTLRQILPDFQYNIVVGGTNGDAQQVLEQAQEVIQRAVNTGNQRQQGQYAMSGAGGEVRWPTGQQ
jgi:hypothetical protein